LGDSKKPTSRARHKKFGNGPRRKHIAKRAIFCRTLLRKAEDIRNSTKHKKKVERNPRTRKPAQFGIGLRKKKIKDDGGMLQCHFRGMGAAFSSFGA